MAIERTTDHKVVKRWMVVAGLGLVVATVSLALFFGRGSSNEEGRPVPAPTERPVPEPSGGSGAPQPQPGEITITLSPDRIASAQIRTEMATEQQNTSASDAGMRTTGVVQSNGYKETPVFPVAGGIVREV